MPAKTLSSSQTSALNAAQFDFDTSRITDCPGPFAALSAAIAAVLLIVTDFFLLLYAGGLEGAMAKLIGNSKVQAVIAVVTLAALVPAVETVVGAMDVAIDCLRAHGHDTSGQEEIRDKVKGGLDIVKKALAKAKKAATE
jgi:hypothetical protein